MHPDPAFRPASEAALRAFAAERVFAHIFASTASGPIVAHTPVTLIDAGHLRFHLSRRNPAAAVLDGSHGIASIAGADGYVSPDWYGLADQVPTWNYVAAEAHGRLHRLDDAATIAQLDMLSAEHEARLAPKPAWTRAKITDGRFEATAKLSQNKPAGVRTGVAAGLAASGLRALAALVESPAP